MAEAGLAQRLMIDASHANSSKNHANQVKVCSDIGQQLSDGEQRIFGVMVESNLVAGRQDLRAGHTLTYGQSITDGCLGWEESVKVLEQLAAAVRKRRIERERASLDV
jgi:3-deoxy-7-phosphoheptulonate synthase